MKATEQKFGILNGPLIRPEADVAMGRMLVLLHGWGADGRDLADLADPLQAMLPDLGLWCPHAPAPCSANPFGRQWFELTNDFFANPNGALPEIEQTAEIIEAALGDMMAECDLDPAQVILGGFSQGGMMSLHIATNGFLPLAGFASLSGALIGEAQLPETGGNHILLAHGKQDEVVPFAASKQAQSALEEAGHQVEFVSRPDLAHGIDMAVLDALGQFCHIVSDV